MKHSNAKNIASQTMCFKKRLVNPLYTRIKTNRAPSKKETKLQHRFCVGRYCSKHSRRSRFPSSVGETFRLRGVPIDSDEAFLTLFGLSIHTKQLCFRRAFFSSITDIVDLTRLVDIPLVRMRTSITFEVDDEGKEKINNS